MTIAAETPAFRPSTLQLAGFAIAGVMSLYMAFNTARAVLAPTAFAVTLGAPLADPADTGFVFVYASRAAFLALLVGWLALRRDAANLRFVALASLVMPLGDAALTAHLGAPASIIARHLIIAVVLLATWALLGARRRVS
jgi:hypothetical protein